MNVAPRTAPTAPDRTYAYRTGEKLGLFLPCLRQRWRPKRNLFAGPYAGEFGYELMQWQGFVRARRPAYEQVHVLTYPGRDYLYEGCSVHHHDIDLKQAGYWYGRLGPAEAHRMAGAKAADIGLKDYDIFDPSLLCTRYHKKLFWRQNFRLLEEPPLVTRRHDVVLHFRAVQKEGPDRVKNYPPEMADELARRCLDRGLSVACIGHPDYAYCPPGVVDYRSVNLRRTVAAICSAHTGLGEASGGMHLVNACGRPSVIWGEGQWRIDPALRWNPFRVPIYVITIETWRPSPTAVCDALIESLKDLRTRTGDFSRPAFHLPPQPIADF